MKRDLDHQSVWLGMLIVAVAAGSGCRTAPKAESPTIGFIQLHRGIHGRPQPETAIRLVWSSSATFASQDQSTGFHAGKYAGQWTEPFVVPNESILLAPVAGVVGALYGTVGHLVANPRHLAAPPSDSVLGQLAQQRFTAFISARASTRPPLEARTGETLVLELSIPQAGLALRDGTFGRFEFVIVLTGRLRDANGTRAYADLWALEHTAAHPMSHWNLLSADQWGEVIHTVEQAVADRALTELDRWLTPERATLTGFTPKIFP